MIMPLDHLPDTIGHPGLRALATHWLELTHGGCGPLPRLADIDPIRIAPVLAHVWVVDAQPDGDFRFHLSGESIARWYGSSPKGRLYSEFYGSPLAEQTAAFCRRALAGPGIVYLRLQARVPDWSARVPVERIAFPLVGPAGGITRLIGASLFKADIINGRGSLDLQPEEDFWYPLAA